MSDEPFSQGLEQELSGSSPETELPEESISPEPVSGGNVPEPLFISPQMETDALVLTVSDYSTIAISSISIGVLSGAIFMIIGFAFLGIVKIFKKV